MTPCVQAQMPVCVSTAQILMNRPEPEQHLNELLYVVPASQGCR